MPGTPFPEIKLSIQKAHLEQLRGLNVKPGAGKPTVPGVPSDTVKQTILDWIKANKDEIDTAIKEQAAGGDKLDWNIGIFTLIESAAVYLRQTETVVGAIEAAKKGEDELAIKLLNESQKDIEEVADAMGLHFVVACDLADEHPDGGIVEWFWNGAFSGIFFPKDTSTPAPFMGLTFKGTNQWEEVILDVSYIPIQAGNYLWDTNVHTGFYYGLFGNFDTSSGTVVPFNLVLGALIQCADHFLSLDAILTHSTGHSLGAAYASLAYAEILRISSDPTSPPPKQFQLRDLYTYASPRVAYNEVPEEVRSHLSKVQHTWRIVADQDPIATMPPPWWPLPQYPYIHLDQAVKVFTDRAPIDMPSEIPDQPVPPIFPPFPSYHYIANYYACVEKALGK